MSKSLKNFTTIREALQMHTPRQIRLMFLLQPWDKPINYSDQTLDEASVALPLYACTRSILSTQYSFHSMVYLYS